MTFGDFANLASDVRPSGMPDKAWEGYFGLVIINNSLNALQGVMDNNVKSGKYSETDKWLFKVVNENLFRAQNAIGLLMDETGRTKALQLYRIEEIAKEVIDEEAK